MHHDSSGNDCPKNGFIMSPSRGDVGETQWSRCSRDVALELAVTKSCLLHGSIHQPPELDHSAVHAESPGRHWTAKRQCEILLRDREAFVDGLQNACQALRCRSPKRSELYLAGPALDGTKCADNKECRAGDCLNIEDNWY